MTAKAFSALLTLGLALPAVAQEECKPNIASAKAKRIATILATENGDDTTREIPNALIGRGEDSYLVTITYDQGESLSMYAVTVGNAECEVRRVERRVRDQN